MITNFRTFDLAVNFYKLTRTIPLTGAIRDQLHRAAQSIALNLAEGRGKATKRDQLRFFTIAMGSLRECQAALIIEGLHDHPSFQVLDTLGASLYKLIKNAH